MLFCRLLFFFFKQKTAYEMRISDWSSDVCSSDLPEEVGGFLRALDGYSGYPITLLACKMLPHVMARPGELRLARWAEFDFEKAVWTVQPERRKMRRPHYLPLSRQVIELWEELRSYVGGRDSVLSAISTGKRPH